ncbi:MAG TPA: tRNA (adenosine(37)-N6)-threonylcarbamoyltransferase complex dimerization subunit type 1 TsaB [Candidatus Blautia faecigallinarum]|uniref:tRNA (Adenosine(37)-N6)-threonylcarbamoyltransferase complex dimerization subunit type 1 TsaB n=1 Tax=Candidatus Blautia faecigallinarum TaxID=2838488 RepID=A0A9D2DT98_9FIRM|nr:tRNA (adenosine(37)-N6)-threonylcarbamoyltransferase complex dimerization subunit type 1 TsaB [Candidatus Blautia faecigallinarum]
MKILALDSSGIVASVAIVEDETLLGEYTVNYKKTHSQTLLPMLDEIGKMTELDLKTVDAIAVAAGPGSFTGLRIGSATAKGLGLALDKPIVAVPTLEALAFNLYDTKGLICPMMDARRSQVYTGIYAYENHELKVRKEQMAVPVTEILEMLEEYKEPVTFLGDGVPVYKDVILRTMRTEISFAPAHVNKQRAGAVAVLGMKYYKDHLAGADPMGRVQAARDHAPEYLRLSQAERERLAREGKQ